MNLHARSRFPGAGGRRKASVALRLRAWFETEGKFSWGDIADGKVTEDGPLFGCRPGDEPADDPVGLTDLGPSAHVMERAGGGLIFHEREYRRAVDLAGEEHVVQPDQLCFGG